MSAGLLAIYQLYIDKLAANTAGIKLNMSTSIPSISTKVDASKFVLSTKNIFSGSMYQLKEKHLFLNELQTLNQIIQDLDGLDTWPFNYNQLTTLLIGLVFPFLPLVFEILFFV